MPRVVLLLDALSRGGTETQMALMARHWPSDAPPLGLVVLSGEMPDEVGFPTSIPVRRVARPRRLDPRLVPRIAHAVRDLDAGLLLAPHRFSGLLAKIVGVGLRIPVVVELRGRAHDTWKRRALYDALDESLLPLAHRVVFNSETVARRFRSRCDLEGKITVILNAVEDPGERGNASPRSPETPLRLLCVGRLVPIKRTGRAIEALATTRHAGIDATLDILGDGPERSRLRQLAARLGVADFVHLRGETGDLTPHYRASDVLVHPSAWENTSNVLLEAMSHGLPCVAHAVGGNVEVLGGGTAGIVVRDENSSAFSDAVRDLASHADARARLGRAARERACAHYSVERCVRQHVELARGVFGGG